MGYGTIKKVMRSETAHIVRGAMSERCKFNFHGHSYVWEVEIAGDIYGDESETNKGMVIDFIELKPIKEFIDKFDHAMILWKGETDEVKDFFHNNCQRVIVMNKNTTAENMARLVHRKVTEWLSEINSTRGTDYVCKAVNVWETVTGMASSSESNFNDNVVFMHGY